MPQPHPVTVDSSVVLRAIELLWQRREADPWFHELLSHPYAAISGFAATRSGRVADLAAEPLLWNLVREQPNTRLQAFLALANLGIHAPPDVRSRIVDGLLAYAVPDGPDSVAAAVSLGAFTDEPGIEAAIRAVAAVSNDDDRDCLLHVLGDIEQPHLGPRRD